MRFHPDLGLSMPELGWVPSPRYLLRRDRILAGLGQCGAGEALEIGCGAGALLKDLRNHGCQCTALETSAPAVKIAQSAHAGDSGVRIMNTMEGQDWIDRFDLAISCEVLEHIEDDAQALSQWVQWLKPGGRFAISVPGRPDKWDSSDVWAGHFRRYTRQSLMELCTSSGLTPDIVESYGYPLNNWIAPFQALRRRGIVRTEKREKKKAEATAASGIDRSIEMRAFPLLDNPFGRWAIRRACRWQRSFLDTDKGLCLLVWATRRLP